MLSKRCWYGAHSTPVYRVWLVSTMLRMAHHLCDCSCEAAHGPLTRHMKLRVAHEPRMPATLYRHWLQRKLLVSDSGMHHGTCVTHVPWCMSGSLTRGGGENVPGIPGACATRNFTYLVRGPLVEMVFSSTESLLKHVRQNRHSNVDQWIAHKHT